jgi:hypothetical protein
MNVSAGLYGLVDWRLQPLLFEPFDYGNPNHLQRDSILQEIQALEPECG